VGSFVNGVDQNFPPIFYWAINTLNKTFPIFFTSFLYFSIYILNKTLSPPEGKSPKRGIRDSRSGIYLSPKVGEVAPDFDFRFGG